MPDSFNSPAHAISFLKRRGLFKETLESTMFIMYIELKHPVTDKVDIEACRYLISKRHPTTYQRNMYDP